MAMGLSSLAIALAGALLLLLLLPPVPRADATTLTYHMAAHEKACFYGVASKENEKMAFYFAVQAGGSFDVDYEVLGPDNKVIMFGQKEKQGDYVFAAHKAGDYSFCFSNVASSYEDKIIDFDVTVERDVSRDLSSTAVEDPNKKEEKLQKAKEEVRPLEEAIMRIRDNLGRLHRDQRYFRLRENRNFDTVKSTEQRIFWLSLVQNGFIVLVAVVQVFVIQTFFSKSSGRGRV
ncbi:ERP3 protein [Zopfochytrium polystomum]|nr:ERP3 protein [Zopfochytrium polystomum]